jgi:hypothetical protein
LQVRCIEGALDPRFNGSHVRGKNALPKRVRRDFSRFASWQLRRKAKDPTIPETADLLEIRSMLEERGMEWREQWKLEGVLEGRR